MQLARKEFLRGIAAMMLGMSGTGKRAHQSKRKRGEFIFFSNRVFEPGQEHTADIETIQQFHVCLTNGYVNFTGKARDTLRTAGCDLFIYLWFNGFYEKELGLASEEHDSIRQFPDMMEAFRTIQAHSDWLLNADHPIQGGGADFPAFFWDYGNPAFRAYYVGFIRERLRRVGYNGVFYDYIGGWALPEAVKALWRERHPEQSYDEAGVLFLRELRQAIPGLRLFGNQAYRLPTDYYDCIDYDISESHGTSFVWGKETPLYIEGKGMQTVRETFYRPWDGAAGYKAISQPRRERMAQRPRVEVFDLNYLQPWYVPTGAQATSEGKSVPVFAPRTDRPAIFYGYALAKLTGIVAFASDWYAPGYGRDDLYFLDLGAPVEPTFHEEPEVVTRGFAHGLVAVTRKGGPVRFSPKSERLPSGVTGLWDVYAQQRVPSWREHHSILIQPARYPATQTPYPSGRIYTYLFD
jgi:hypothetical protein